MHPGGTKQKDAKPVFFSINAAGRAPRISPGSAAEHAAHEWETPGEGGVFTTDRAKTIPQRDQKGKQEIWNTVQDLRTEGLLVHELDITDGMKLRWWLWICNLAAYTNRVIGTGVCGAHVSMHGENTARFRFVRTDGTSSIVLLTKEEFPHTKLVVSMLT